MAQPDPMLEIPVDEELQDVEPLHIKAPKVRQQVQTVFSPSCCQRPGLHNLVSCFGHVRRGGWKPVLFSRNILAEAR